MEEKKEYSKYCSSESSLRGEESIGVQAREEASESSTQSHSQSVNAHSENEGLIIGCVGKRKKYEERESTDIDLDLDIAERTTPKQQGREKIYQNPNKTVNIRRQREKEEIIDEQGIFNYEEDKTQYMKARKRKQNRESAQRTRQKKSTRMQDLEGEVDRLTQMNSHLNIANEGLRVQNDLLNTQLLYFQRLFAQGNNTRNIGTRPQGPNNISCNHHIPLQESLLSAPNTYFFGEGGGAEESPPENIFPALSECSGDAPLFSEYRDGDLAFLGGLGERRNSLGLGGCGNIFVTTLVFAMIFLISLVIQPGGEQEEGGRGRKLDEGEGMHPSSVNDTRNTHQVPWWTLFLDPYVILAAYFALLAIFTLWRLSGWRVTIFASTICKKIRRIAYKKTV